MENKIILKTETLSIPVSLNDTVAARDFMRRLPLTVSGVRGEDDYHFSVAIGRFNPEETQSGWKNGDISIAGGWLRIFFGGEKGSGNHRRTMVIAHIDEKNINLIRELSENIRLRVERSEQ